MRRGIAILIAAGLVMPHAAHALGERPWIALNAVGGTYNMKDLNTYLDESNTTYGVSFPHVDGGYSMGGAIGVDLPGHWSFGGGIDRLQANTKASDPSGTLEYRFGANAWRAFAEYAFTPLGSSGIFVGGSAGFVQEGGHIIFTSPGVEPMKFKTSGSAPLFEGYAGGNWWLTSSFAVTGTAGYRYARLKEFKVEGSTFPKTNGEPLPLDFSGPTFRIGFKVAAKPVSF